jgi:hypothetical protein
MGIICGRNRRLRCGENGKDWSSVYAVDSDVFSLVGDGRHRRGSRERLALVWSDERTGDEGSNASRGGSEGCGWQSATVDGGWDAGSSVDAAYWRCKPTGCDDGSGTGDCTAVDSDVAGGRTEVADGSRSGVGGIDFT